MAAFTTFSSWRSWRKPGHLVFGASLLASICASTDRRILSGELERLRTRALSASKVSVGESFGRPFAAGLVGESLAT